MSPREPLLALVAGVAFLGTLPAWMRVFEDRVWLAPVLLAAALAIVLAALLRRARLVAPLSAGLSLLALLALTPWLTGLAPHPVLPTPTAVRELVDTLVLIHIEVRSTRAPIPTMPGVLTALVLGAWAIAHLGHELLVRWRLAGLALVPFAGLWLAALAVPLPAGRDWPEVVPFLAGAAVVLLVTATDDRRSVELARPSRAGVTIGALAIAVGAAAPGLLPGYGASSWLDLAGSDSPRGYQPIVDISERLSLPEERDVLRMHSSQRAYLRLAGLDSFDGHTWRLGPPQEGSYQPPLEALYVATDVLPPEEPAASTEAVFAEVEVLALENIYVPVPYQPVEVFGSHRDEMVWSTEGGFLATWETAEGELGGDPRVGITPGVSYRIQAARPTPSYDDLVDLEFDQAVIDRHTQLPRAYPRLEEAAELVYAAAGAETIVDKALALQDWFIGDEAGFVYDLDVAPLRGDDALEHFVLEDRVGYCEYYATAMAVMLRATGIPARVAVGFLPGRMVGDPYISASEGMTEYLVSTSDAHAWVEVLFPGHGWVTFEPTPRDDLTQIVPTSGDLAPIENLAERMERQGLDPLAEGPAVPRPEDVPEDGQLAQEQPGGTGGPTERSSAPVWLAGLVLFAGAAGTLLVARRRRLTPSDRSATGRILHAQRRLLISAARHGVGRRPQETTLEVMGRWRREHRIDHRGEKFAHTVQRAAFGGQVDDDLASEAERTVQELEEMLLRSVDRRDRLVAPLRRPASAALRNTRRIRARLRSRERSW